MIGGRNLKAWLIIVFLLGILCTAASGRTIYVDYYGPGDFNNIQAAINDANNGDTIIVADGTYTGPGNRDINFNGKAITVCSENGPENCIIDCNGTESDRHRGFYFHSGEDVNSAIIGFTITNGYAPLEYIPPPTSMWFSQGGAIYCCGSSPTISNCIISGNCAYGGGEGGGICTWGGRLTISNCTFSGNWADYYGGGICTWGGSPTITNCILWGDFPMEIYGGTPKVTYSDVQGGWPGLGNIANAPIFSDAANGDYHLKSKAGRWDPNSQSWVHDDVTSPCVDAGNPNSPIGLEPFPNGGLINMGAYGGTPEASKSYFGEPICETIVAGDINGDCNVNFLDFQIIALHWLEER